MPRIKGHKEPLNSNPALGRCRSEKQWLALQRIRHAQWKRLSFVRHWRRVKRLQEAGLIPMNQTIVTRNECERLEAIHQTRISRNEEMGSSKPSED